MRRWLHCLLIGVLTCSLSVDTAKACWYLRRAPAGCGDWRPACPPVATWSTCHAVVIESSAWCGEPVCGAVVVVDAWSGDGCCVGDVVCGPVIGRPIVDQVVVRDGIGTVTEPTAVAGSVAQAREPGVAAEPTPAPPQTPAPAEPITAPQPAAETGVATVAPSVPELKPAVDAKPDVEAVVAIEPAPVEPAPVEPKPAEPATEPVAAQPLPTDRAPTVEPPAAAAVVEPSVEPKPAQVEAVVEPPAPPAEPNIFEEVEAATDAAILGTDSVEPETPPSEPASVPAADDLFAEPAAAPKPAVDPVTDAVEPAADSAGEPADADAAAPAVEAPAVEPAAGEADPVSDAGREPLRRWVDDTGSYATVGMLVDVRDDAVEIRKTSGRTVIVPLERLSEHDREYAAAAGARLAAERSPSSNETVGL